MSEPTTVLTLTKAHRADQAEQQYAYDPQVIDNAVMVGDMKQMDKATRLAFYRAVCLSVGLNPLTQPFTPLERQDKTVWLYANSSATQQLAKIHQVSFRDMEREQTVILGEPFYTVRVVASTPDGRAVPSQSVVALTKKKRVANGKWPSGDVKFTDALDTDGEPVMIPLRGEALANAMMKADTKALRRATLALIGLGWMQSDYEGKPVTLNMQTGEIIEDARAVPAMRLLDAPTEQAKGLQGHIGDLYGDPPPAPLHPIWGTIATWYAEAGRPEQYAQYQQWACRRYRATTIADIAETDLAEMAAKVYATLEPLIVARQAAQEHMDLPRGGTAKEEKGRGESKESPVAIETLLEDASGLQNDNGEDTGESGPSWGPDSPDLFEEEEAADRREGQP